MWPKCDNSVIYLVLVREGLGYTQSLITKETVHRYLCRNTTKQLCKLNTRNYFNFHLAHTLYSGSPHIMQCTLYTLHTIHESRA